MIPPPDTRFDDLLRLASIGNEEAVADLWHEFAYDARNHLPQNGSMKPQNNTKE